MMRLNLVLTLGVVVSALYLVSVQYDSRRLYSGLDLAQAQALRLAAENERLQVEKRAQATSSRVEKLAKTGLQMRSANPTITTYVAQPQSAAIPGAPHLAGQQAAVAAAAAPGKLP